MKTKTNIICTLGPKSDSKTEIKKLIQSGMTVARLNFSHGTYNHHQKMITNLRQADEELDRKTKLLIDLQGPKIRVGKLNKIINVKRAQKILLLCGSEAKTQSKLVQIPVQYNKFASDIAKDNSIFIDDGLIELKVLSKTDSVIKCLVLHGGQITSNKGINAPEGKIGLTCLTKKDQADLRFALNFNPDYIAVSFVRTGQDILNIKNLTNVKIVAKIETPQAITNLDEIAMVSDLLMVARGDLGVECGITSVPKLQLQIIKTSHKYNKPAIVATQMMASMIKQSIPTRAEISDIAYSLEQGADMLMLSNETSVGNYPSQAVHIMKAMIKKYEN